jgi:hypothetical protein
MVLALFIAIGVLLNLTILPSSFLSDDFGWIFLVKQNGPLGIWSSEGFRFLRPIISISLYLDYRLWGLNPVGYHLTNVLVHALNSVLVYGIAARLFKPALADERTRMNAALACGLFFLVLPSHTESVTWISGRTDLIATAFYLGAFASYLTYRTTNAARSLIASLGLLGLALLSKEIAITFPIVVGGYELYRYLHGRPAAALRAAFGLTALYTALVTAYVMMRAAIIGSLVGGYGTAVHLAIYPLALVRTTMTSITRIFLPGVSLWQGLPIGILGVLLLMLVGGVFVMKLRGQAEARLLFAFLLAAALIQLLPIINLSPSPTKTTGERFIYFPSVWWIMLLVYSLTAMVPQKRALLAGGAVLLVAYSLVLVHINGRWQRASNAAAALVATIGTMGDRERIIVLNLPDTLEGVFMFRDNLPEAVALTYDSSLARKLEIMAFGTLERTASIAITRQGTSYMVQLKDAIITGHRYPLNAHTAAYDVVSQSPTAYTVDVKQPLRPADTVVYFEDGQLKEFSAPN